APRGCSSPGGWPSPSAPGTSTASAAGWRWPRRRRRRARGRRRGRNEFPTLAIDAPALDAALGHRAFALHAGDAVLAELLRQALAATQGIAPVLGRVAGVLELAAACRLTRRRGLAQAVLAFLVGQAADAQGAVGLVAIGAVARRARAGLRDGRVGSSQHEHRNGHDGAEMAAGSPRRRVVGSM